MKEYAAKQPSPWVSVLPLAVLTLLLYVVIRCFGGDAINGGSQIALLSATSVCVMLAIGIYRCKWAVLEEAIIDNIRASASAIIILLLIGAIAGSWMVSGVVPTMIYYGLIKNFSLSARQPHPVAVTMASIRSADTPEERHCIAVATPIRTKRLIRRRNATLGINAFRSSPSISCVAYRFM